MRILLDLHEHRVLTTQQITELHFPSYHVGWKRLHLLEQLGFVRHFQPAFWHGSAPYHFVLDQPGALLVAVRLDSDLKTLGWKPDDAIRIARSQARDHLVQANGFFTRLAWRCRTSGRARLTEWVGERRANRGWGVAIKPDGVGRVIGEASDVWFFFELDRGTETHGQLIAKLRRYSEVALLPDVPRTLLIAFPTERREMEARRALHSPGLSVATTVLELSMADPLAPVWLPVGEPIRRPLLGLSPADGAVSTALGGMGGPKESITSVTPAERPSANVTNGVYDAASNETPPPCAVAGIRVEPMDPAAAELLARDLLELLEWARTGKE